MPVTIVQDLVFGDCGKGKLCYFLAKDYDAGVRYSGGANAGHTIYTHGNQKVVTHLVPATLLLDKPSFITPGVLLDPEKLCLEMSKYELDESKLFIDSKCPIVTEQHIAFDILHGGKIGTTGSGIGPCLAGQIARTGIRVNDYLKKGDILCGEVEDTGKALRKLLKQGKNILCEGAQGHYLDLWHGTYPYVTSSLCTSGAVCTNAGIPFQEINKVIGIFKAYSTRVGNGPFRTEVWGEEADWIKQKGNEFGSTTGRPRRIGWLDLPDLKEACEINGVTELALMKSDILFGFPRKIQVCWRHYNNVPNYKAFNSWNSIVDQRFYDFINFIEDYLQLSIRYISSGPEASDMIVR